jgi:nucleoside-diphosphate-sugar epimerase
MKGDSATGKILITGANGFIGRHLMKRASTEGLNIRATDISSPKEIPEGIEFVHGDLTSIEFARNITQDLDGVVHLAAVSRVSIARNDPAACISINVLGTATLLQALYERNSKPWFILISTREVERIMKFDVFPELDDIYAISKRTAEDIAIWFCRKNNSSLFIFRLSDVYGDLESDDNPPKVLSIFLSRALQNLPIDVHHPDMLFYFSHISDVVNTLLQGIKEIRDVEAGFEIRRIWTAQCISLLDLAKLICNLTGSHSEIRVGSILKTSPDSEKWGGCSDYQFSHTVSLEEGFRCLIAGMDKSNLSDRKVN